MSEDYLGNVFGNIGKVSNTSNILPDINTITGAGNIGANKDFLGMDTESLFNMGNYGQDAAKVAGGNLFSSESLGGISSVLGGLGSFMGYMNAKEQNEMIGDELERKAALDRTNLANQAKAANENLAYKSGRRATNQGLSGAERDASIAGTMDKYGLSGVAA